jgi:Transcriptional repressor TCF25
VQASHDPNAIAELLHHTPYHTDALLAMSELYRVGRMHCRPCMAALLAGCKTFVHLRSQVIHESTVNQHVSINRNVSVYHCSSCGHLQSMGDQSQADDMLDRCLYAFEMAWHHSFSIASANCMLDPERNENKGFLEALFRQLQVLSHSYLNVATLANGWCLVSHCQRPWSRVVIWHGT